VAYAEAQPALGFSAETPESIMGSIQDTLGPYLLGKDLQTVFCNCHRTGRGRSVKTLRCGGCRGCVLDASRESIWVKYL
jgi:hypothetical protein